MGDHAIDIRELRTFVAVARAGSVSRAAEQLRVAQPALSRQLHKLEDALGAMLFLRHGRGVTLTPSGALLLSRAEALIRQFEQLPHEIRAPGDDFTGHVVLGVPPTAGLLIAPAVLKEFRLRWPDATLQIREGISSLLEEWLVDRRVDVAVLHNPPPLDDIDIVPLLAEHMVLACPPDSALAGRPIRFQDLGAVPLILPSMPHSNRRLVERAARQHATRLHLAIEVDSVPLTKAMVAQGVGSTILTHAGVAHELGTGALVARSIHRPPLMSTISLGTARGMHPLWLTTALNTLVRDVIARLVDSGAWPGARLIEPEDVPQTHGL
jgi:LysR family nitrogen assimilation transcriptional regulator